MLRLESNDVFTPVEAAEVLRIGKNSIYRLIHSGQIHTIQVGKKFLIPKTAIICFMEQGVYNNTCSSSLSPSSASERS